MTKEEIQKELDELGIEYDAEAKKPELELKLAEAKDKAEEESAEVEEPQEEKESVEEAPEEETPQEETKPEPKKKKRKNDGMTGSIKKLDKDAAPKQAYEIVRNVKILGENYWIGDLVTGKGEAMKFLITNGFVK